MIARVFAVGPVATHVLDLALSHLLVITVIVLVYPLLNKWRLDI